MPQETKRLDRLEQALVQLAAVPRPKVLEAELILIRDTNGTIRAALGAEIPHQDRAGAGRVDDGGCGCGGVANCQGYAETVMVGLHPRIE